MRPIPDTVALGVDRAHVADAVALVHMGDDGGCASGFDVDSSWNQQESRGTMDISFSRCVLYLTRSARVLTVPKEIKSN